MAEYTTDYVIKASVDIKEVKDGLEGIRAAINQYQTELNKLALTIPVKVGLVGGTTTSTTKEVENQVKNLTSDLSRLAKGKKVDVPIGINFVPLEDKENVLQKVVSQIEKLSSSFKGLHDVATKNIDPIAGSFNRLNVELKEASTNIDAVIKKFGVLSKDVAKATARASKKSAQKIDINDILQDQELYNKVFGLTPSGARISLSGYGYPTLSDVVAQQTSYRRRRMAIARQVADYAGVPFEAFDFTKHFREDQIKAIQNRIQQLRLQAKELGTSVYDTIQIFDQLGNRMGQFAVLVERNGNVLVNFERNITSLFRNMVYRMGVWAIATGGVYLFINSIKQAIGYIKDLSRQLALLQIASEKLDFGKIYTGMEGLSKQYGAPMGDVIDITYQFVKVLDDERSALEATRLALIAYNISGLEYKESAELITAVMRQYNLTIEETRSLVDGWAVAARKGSVDFKELADAFSQVAASAKEVGIAPHQLTALIEAVGTATGETGPVLGTFMKFITEHYKDVETLRSLESVVPVYTQTGEIRSMYDVLIDLSKVWKDLSESQKNNISVTWASYRQGARFKALMESMPEVMKIYRLAQEGAGEAAYQNVLVMTTLDGAVRKFSATWSDLVARLGESGLGQAFMFMVTMFNKILDLLNYIPGGINVILGFITALIVKFGYQAYKGIGVVGQAIRQAVEDTSALGMSFEKATATGTQSMNVLARGVDNVTSHLEAQGNVIRANTQALQQYAGVLTAGHIENLIAQTTRKPPEVDYWGSYLERQDVSGERVKTPVSVETIGAGAKGFYGQRIALAHIRRMLEEDVTRSKSSIIKELQRMGLGYRKEYMISDIDLIKGQMLAVRAVRRTGQALKSGEGRIGLGETIDFASLTRETQKFEGVFTRTINRIKSTTKDMWKDFGVLPDILARITKGASLAAGAFRGLGNAIKGILWTIPELLAMTAIFSAIYAGIQKIGEAVIEGARQKALREKYMESSKEWTYEGIQEEFAEYQRLRQLKPLSWGERRVMEELERKEGLTEKEKEILRGYQERYEGLQRAKELEEKFGILLPEFGGGLIGKQARERYMEQLTIEELARRYEEKTGKPLRHMTEEERKLAEGKLIPPDLKYISQIETIINKALSEISSRIEVSRNNVELLKESFMDLGYSSEYVSLTLSKMSEWQREVSSGYQQIQERIPFVNNQLEQLQNQFETWKKAVKGSKIYEDLYGGRITEEEARKSKEFDEKKYEEYKNYIQGIESLKNIQQNLNAQSSQYLLTMQQIYKTMLQTVMSSIKYAGVWESIQNRINLVKQSIAELRLLSREPGLTIRLASMGERFFGTGWDKYSFMIERTGSQIDSLWNSIIKLEESIALSGDDQNKLRQALEEIEYGELGSELKKAVTAPLSGAIDKNVSSVDKNTMALDKATESINDLPSKLEDKLTGEEKARIIDEIVHKEPISSKTVEQMYSKEYLGNWLYNVGLRGEIDYYIAKAILRAEGGWFNVMQPEYGGGFYSVGRNWEKWGLSEYEARLDEIKDYINTYKSWRSKFQEGTIEDWVRFLGSKYAPIGAGNDPNNLNRFWVPNVLNALREFGINLSKTYKTSAVLEEHRQIVSDAQKVKLEEEQKLAERIKDQYNNLLGLLKNIPNIIDTTNKLRAVFPEGIGEEPELYRDTINRVINEVIKVPQYFTEEMKQAIEEVVDKYYTKLYEVNYKEYKDRLDINNKLSLIDENLARKRSEIIKETIDKLIETAYTAPAEQLNKILKIITELSKQFFVMQKAETWKEILKDIGTTLTMSRLTGTPADWSGIGGNILSKLQDLLVKFPQYSNEIESQIKQVQAFIDRAKFDSTVQAAEVLKYVRSLQSATFGTPEYYKQASNVKMAYQNLYTLEEKVSDLSELFQNLAAEMPDIYSELSQVKAQKAGRDIYLLVEQLKQVTERLNQVTPLSREYFTILEDVVNLHTKENELLAQREELTKKYFELTAKGLEEYVKIAGQVQAYRMGLLQAQVITTRNAVLGGEYTNTDEYYALLGELVSLEKQWLGILSERRDILTESFKLGVIGLKEYVNALKELVNETYDSRAAILDFYNTITSGIKSDFSEALSSALSGSLTYQTDFIASIKKTLGSAVSEAITNAIIEATGIKSQLQNIITSITESVYSSGQIDVEGLKGGLNDILKVLSGYLPVYQRLLSGIFETLKDQVFNAPTGFKIEPYLYQYLKGRGPEAIPGLPFTPTQPKPVEMPTTRPTEVVEPVPSVPANPILQGMEQVVVALDGNFGKLSETINGHMFTIEQLLNEILRALEVQKQIIPAIPQLPPTTFRPSEYEMVGDKAVLPARVIGAMLGEKVDWDEVSRQVIIGGKRFAPLKVEEPGTAYLSIREVFEAFGRQVDWDDVTRNVTISQDILNVSGNIEDEVRKMAQGIIDAKIGYQRAVDSGNTYLAQKYHEAADKLRNQLSSLTGLTKDQVNQIVVSNWNLGSISQNGVNQLMQAIQQTGLLGEVKGGIYGLPKAFEDAIRNIPTPIVNVTNTTVTSSSSSSRSSSGSSGTYRVTDSSGRSYTVTGSLAQATEIASGGSRNMGGSYTIDFRGYQHGGIALWPHLGLVAEKGPEVMIPLERLPEIIYKMGFSSSQNSSNQPINVNVSVDARGSTMTEADVARAVRAGVQEGIRELQSNVRLTNLRFKGVPY